MQAIRTFIHDEGGASAVEYGLIAGLISLVIIGALTAISGYLGSFFARTAEKISTMT